jgi:hypothetical protein
MGRIDEAAARLEVLKAEECTEHAEQLSVIADQLRKEAEHHLREAQELRGHVSVRRSR